MNFSILKKETSFIFKTIVLFYLKKYYVTTDDVQSGTSTLYLKSKLPLPFWFIWKILLTRNTNHVSQPKNV